MSGSAEPRAFPWLCPYIDDGPRSDQVVQRPVVSTALVGPTGEVGDGLYALVDSGCSHVLAAPWVADAVGVDSRRLDRTLRLGIGGTTVGVRFVDLRVRLLAPGGTDDEFVEWATEVTFLDEWRPTFPMILGQRGFLDEFTVSVSQFARMTAVEHRDEFDRRFGVPLPRE